MRFLHVTVVLLLILVPPAIYFSLELIQPRYFAIGLIALFLARMIPVCKHHSCPSVLICWSLLMALAFLSIAISNHTLALLLYPVVMNAGFLLLFLYSLFFPPSIIETIARMKEPELPETGVRYTRKVTMVWSVFFLLNGLVAGWTVWKGDYDLWGLYNGCLAYILMAMLMAAEYWVRGIVRKSIENE